MDGTQGESGKIAKARRAAIAAEIERLRTTWQIVQARIDLYAGQPEMTDRLLPLIIEGDRLSLMIEQLERAKAAGRPTPTNPAIPH
ncbi:hypothetical protein [Dongia rigui]|uniref:Uncharacterized protein n=1 Tax=Dongia rigui TaxID=940149 RepID=A0ABU5E252_9PROT|nr:hypothetical protein [Dongia rigui]MDY0873689.1 hypothetical protein [Dongia rigui]